jgi:rRNA-processing protein FCF1
MPRPTALVFDANILVLLIALDCLIQTGQNAADRFEVLRKIRGRDDDVSLARFDELRRVFDRTERRIVTQRVLAEVYGLRKKLRFEKALVWDVAANLLLNPGKIEECSCSLTELYARDDCRKIVREIGPTDAGIIYTAETRKCAIVTDDGELRSWAWVRLVESVSLDQIQTLLD